MPVGHTWITGPRSSAGFSLVELMVIVVIIGMVAGIALPNFRTQFQSYRLRNAGMEFFNTLSLARSEAIKRNGDVTITMADDGWRAGWTVTAADGTSIVTQPQLGDANQVAITVPAGQSSVVYRRSGRLSAATAPYFLIDIPGGSPDDDSLARCVTVELSGMPNLKRMNVAGATCP